MTSCIDVTTKERPVCVCCEKVYTNVDSALSCIENKQDMKSKGGDRFLLIAFVNKDLKAYQKLGWDILKDQDIIKTVKKDYLLVILDTAQINILNKKYSIEIPEYDNNETLFVMSNSALYAFGSWTFKDKKESIIYWLEIGDGP